MSELPSKERAVPDGEMLSEIRDRDAKYNLERWSNWVAHDRRWLLGYVSRLHAATAARASNESKPPHLREPPHCSTCGCGLPVPEPASKEIVRLSESRLAEVIGSMKLHNAREGSVHGDVVWALLELQERRAAPEPRAADAEDMENIGRAFIEALARNLPGYSWSECPSEVIVDLVNQRDDARGAQPPDADLREALRGLLEIEDARIATGAFKPNAEGQRRIDAARSALTKGANDAK